MPGSKQPATYLSPVRDGEGLGQVATSQGMKHPNHKPGQAQGWRGWSINVNWEARQNRDETRHGYKYAEHPLGARLCAIGMPTIRFRDLLAVRCGQLYPVGSIMNWMYPDSKAHCKPNPDYYEDIAEILGVTEKEVGGWW